jgi:hypothetical protein
MKIPKNKKFDFFLCRQILVEILIAISTCRDIPHEQIERIDLLLLKLKV